MNPTTPLTLIHLVSAASWPVQAVMAVLLLMSIYSWTITLAKVWLLARMRARNRQFERNFWAAKNLFDLHKTTASLPQRQGPLGRTFLAGMAELQRLRERRITEPANTLEGVRRALRAQLQRESDSAETHITGLASVGSVAPYVGLFGTVWGIMHAFNGLGGLEQISLAAVAPGITEALVATALGLACAIPAVLAYNRITAQLERIASQMDIFCEEFSNLLHRNLAAGPSSGAPGAAASTEPQA